MQDIIRDFFCQATELKNPEPILVGVSGGADSLCLLDLLIKSGRRVIVAHFNHQLRVEAWQEAELVREMAEQRKLQFVQSSQDVRKISAEKRISIEEAARKLRYQFLFDQARLSGAGCVAVGHHADDQVETILMHFLRGAGLSGLKGMSPVTWLDEFDLTIPLIRPLLKAWRKEIETYCKENGLSAIEDASNQDVKYFRNKLRHDLIPEMERYNPGFKRNLLKSAESLNGDMQIIDEVVKRKWEKLISEESKNRLSFKFGELSKMNEAILRNIFRLAVRQINPSLRDIGFEGIDRLVKNVKGTDNPFSRMDLGGGISAYQESDLLIIGKDNWSPLNLKWPQVEASFELHPGETYDLGNNWWIESDLMKFDELPFDIHSNTDKFLALLDHGMFKNGLQVRGKQNGDRMQSLGMESGNIKLSDVFINEKFPQSARGKWPVICSGGEIIWVPGYRIAHRYRVLPATREILRIKIFKNQ